MAWVPRILEAGVQVLMFVGAEDLICNYKGIEKMAENLEWGGIRGMEVSHKKEDPSLTSRTRR